MWIYNPETELYHYGVKGMKWGVRKKRPISSFQSKRNATKAANEARKKSIAESRASGDTGLGSFHRANRKALNAKRKAYGESIQRDREYNRQLKEENAAAKADKIQAKAEKKVSKKYAKAGKVAGEAAYERDKGDRSYEAHKKNADVFDKAAAKYEREGSYFKAEAARKSANALRTRGENIRAEQYEIADSYLKRSNKLNKKAADVATKKNVDLGKKKINTILEKSKKEGYESAKAWDEFDRDMELYDALGSDGYDMYNKLRGKSGGELYVAIQIH